MGLRPHYLLDLCIGAAAVLALFAYWCKAQQIQPASQRQWVRFGLAVAAVLIVIGTAMSPIRVARQMPTELVQWMKGIALLVSAWTFYSLPVLAVLNWSSKRMPGRRRFLRTVAGASMAVPGVVAAAAFIRRDDLQFREFDIDIPGLPKDLNGLRIVQISDIHLSAFVSRALLERAIGMANEARGHVVLVTGDLISVAGDPLDTCLDLLGGLRSDAGTFGCLGNHEIYATAERYTTLEGARRGMRFLRGESQVLRFGSADLNLAGVDYQRRSLPYLRGAESLIQPGATNLLLSHNPDVFPVAASQGFDLTIAGHTHGGQVNFEILDHNVNIARFFTPYIYGRYWRDGKSLFVTRGIGTVGAPARLGAPPEVALIRLCDS